MTDFDKTQIFKVIAPVRNQKPTIHKPCIFFDLLSKEIFREGKLQVPEISFKTRQTIIFNGIIVVMSVFDIIPLSVFRVIPVPAPGFRFVNLTHKTADDIQLPPFQILCIFCLIVYSVTTAALSFLYNLETFKIET